VETQSDEHVIRCSVCGRGLIVRDNINNGVAFLSHLKNDHGIYYTAQRMVESKQKNKEDVNKQELVGQNSPARNDT
jgi:hypothetical protein